MKLKLHAFPLSPRSFKVLAVANHLGIEHDLVFCDLTKGEQRRADFGSINPNHKVPALEDGDFKLWESNAMIQYLASLKPESGLLPKDERARANVVQSWGQLDAAKAQIDATRSQVTAAEIALNGVREEARVGQRTTLDVLNATQELLNARVALVTAQRDRVVASYTLLSAVGRLAPKLALGLDYFAVVAHAANGGGSFSAHFL